MGVSDEEKVEADDDDDEDDDDDADLLQESSPPRPRPKETPKVSPPVTSPIPLSTETPKKRRRMGGISSVFSKKSTNIREIDLNQLVKPDAVAPEFSMLLAKILTYGAPGRFPIISSYPGGMPMESFDLEKAKDMIMKAREDAALTDEMAAETFASVVNCVIIDIIDLASSSLGVKEKKDKVTVDAFETESDRDYQSFASGASFVPLIIVLLLASTTHMVSALAIRGSDSSDWHILTVLILPFFFIG